MLKYLVLIVILNMKKISFGLIDRANECDKVVNFYTIALEVISKGDIFDHKIHLPKDFYN